MSRQRICVDFDGTIFDGQGIFPGCIETLRELHKTYRIAIFSARPTEAERNHMLNILEQHRVPYDEILPPKPDAAFYIDDKGRQFQGWDKVTL
jgi:ribonucleotide monophosphatase NagD (HAD superfamily)